MQEAAQEDGRAPGAEDEMRGQRRSRGEEEEKEGDTYTTGGCGRGLYARSAKWMRVRNQPALMQNINISDIHSHSPYLHLTSQFTVHSSVEFSMLYAHTAYDGCSHSPAVEARQHTQLQARADKLLGDTEDCADMRLQPYTAHSAMPNEWFH